MSDYHTIKPKLPIISVGQGNCPHGDEFVMTIKLHGQSTVYMCTRCNAALEDWYRFSRDEFYTKYPELKPPTDYSEIRVTLDEADKRPK